MKKKKTAVCIILLLIAAITAGIYLWKEKAEAAQEEQGGQSAIEAGENQELQYGLITDITGNEITIQLLKETDIQRMQQSRESGAPQPGAPQSGAPQSGAPQSGAPQSGALQSGAPQSGAPQSGAEEDTRQPETKTYQVPVGTQVETKLGNITTFSRLAAGDRIAVLSDSGAKASASESAAILKIWIIE